MLERDLERNARMEVEDLGGWMLKWVSPGQNGVPDNLIFWPGGVVHFVEFKKPDGGKRTWQQTEVHKDLHKLGTKVFTIYSEKDWEAYLRRRGK